MPAVSRAPGSAFVPVVARSRAGERCDGPRDPGRVVAAPPERSTGAEPREVRDFLDHLAAKRCGDRYDQH
ncbi:hypothetical protein [Saccharopolyspora halophila]|uniref:hypothetical protein n=1 Tax=Saccharopolyspora halophila TaxID=405551 RepID=UPI0031E06322